MLDDFKKLPKFFPGDQARNRRRAIATAAKPKPRRAMVPGSGALGADFWMVTKPAPTAAGGKHCYRRAGKCFSIRFSERSDLQSHCGRQCEFDIVRLPGTFTIHRTGRMYFAVGQLEIDTVAPGGGQSTPFSTRIFAGLGPFVADDVASGTPEPNTFVLLLGGAVFALGARRRIGRSRSKFLHRQGSVVAHIPLEARVGTANRPSKRLGFIESRFTFAAVRKMLR